MPLRRLFQDAARFGRIGDRRRRWAPLPTRPPVGHRVVREDVDAMTAVCPHDGPLISPVMPWVDAETMSIFPGHTAQTFAGAFGVMPLDGAGWHRAAAVRIPKTIRLIPLPPYSSIHVDP